MRRRLPMSPKFLLTPKAERKARLQHKFGRWRLDCVFGKTPGELYPGRFMHRIPGAKVITLPIRGGSGWARRLARLAGLGALGYGYFRGIGLVLAEEEEELANAMAASAPPSGSQAASASPPSGPGSSSTVDYPTSNLLMRLVKALGHVGLTAGIVMAAGSIGAGVGTVCLLSVVLNGAVHYLWIRIGRDPGMSALDEALACGAFPSWANCPPSVVSPILFFDTPPSIDELTDIIVRHLPRYDRFASVPKPSPYGIGWTWEKVPVDIARHVKERTVNDEVELREAIAELTLGPLQDPSIPRWEMHLVRNKRGRSALVSRIDHCIGDGLSFATAFQGLTTDLDGNPVPPPAPFKRKETSFAPSLTRLVDLVSACGAVVCLPFAPRDSYTPLRPNMPLGATGCGRQIVTLPEVPLDLVKATKNKAGVSVNDVLLAAFAGAIKRYLDVVNPDDKSVRRMRALMPVAFPRKRHKGEKEFTAGVENKWSFASLPLHVSRDSTRTDRLVKTHEATVRLKNSPMVPIQKLVQDALFHLVPLSLTRHICADLMSGHSVCISNVPGPQKALAIAGKEVVAVEVVFPNVIPQVSLFSYRGVVCGNLVVDPVTVPRPQLIADFFGEEIKRLALVYA